MYLLIDDDDDDDFKAKYNFRRKNTLNKVNQKR